MNKRILFWLNAAALLAFVAGAAATTQLLIELPNELISTGWGGHAQWVVGLTLAAALLALLLGFLYQRSAALRQVVYVERRGDERPEDQAVASENLEQPGGQRRWQQLRPQLAAAAQGTADERAEKLLRLLCQDWEAVQGAFFTAEEADGTRRLRMSAGYAYFQTEGTWPSFAWGEGLVGQVGRTATPLHLSQVPQNYLTVLSGLGQTQPRTLLLFPVLHAGQVTGVVEMSLFRTLTDHEQALLTEVGEALGDWMTPAPAVPAADAGRPRKK